MPGEAPPVPQRWQTTAHNALTGRGRSSGCRLGVAILLAIPFGIFGFIVSDLVAWASGAGCPESDKGWGLGVIAIVIVLAGGLPALVAGFRRAALLPLALGAAGPVLIFVLLFFSQGNASDCL